MQVILATPGEYIHGTFAKGLHKKSLLNHLFLRSFSSLDLIPHSQVQLLVKVIVMPGNINTGTVKSYSFSNPKNFFQK